MARRQTGHTDHRSRHASRERHRVRPRRTSRGRRPHRDPHVSHGIPEAPAMTVLAIVVFFAAKNLRVLNDVPDPQLITTMAFISNSLGVTCAHCHDPAHFESDEKPAKETARKMITMQRAINEQQFGGKLNVTCNTCHQGHVKPPATPDVANAGWNATPAPAPPQFIPAEEAINALPETKDTQRTVRGTVERWNGRDEPKREPFTLTIGKSIEYETKLSHPNEATRALVIYSLPKPSAERLKVERWLVTKDSIRRVRETATPLGSLPEQIDHTDFRITPAGRLPFRSQWSRADYRVTYIVESIEPKAVEKTVENTRKNIKVLKGLPEHELFMAMNVVATSLGVHCDYCHVGTGKEGEWVWDSDAKPMKLVGRDMMKMTLGLKGVTCYSCHRGSTKVARTVPLPPHDWSTPPPPVALPSSGELLARYAKASGEPRPVVMIGRIDSKRESGPTRMTVQLPSPKNVEVTGIERVGDRDAYVARDGATTYYFDTQTSLLLRRIKITSETILGPLPEQTDYEDYRDVDGMKVPF